MRMSKLWGRRERTQYQADEAISQHLLHKAGYVRQHAAGIYSFLHLGLRSLRKIEAIVREEMDHTGAQEILMSVVHAAEVWKTTGRYHQIDDTLVRFSDRQGRDMVLAMTHEEIVAQLAASEIQSYRDAGVVVYQIQTKFRDELRSRGGLLRTREFIMKDAYSLHLDQAGLSEAYEVQARAYARIFQRLGLRDVYQIESDTGLMGGTGAHEFTCLLDVGEDSVYLCEGCGGAWNQDVVRHAECERCGGDFAVRRGVEVGNIFQLGTRYTDALGIKVLDKAGKRRSVVMGSYGIGVSRLLGALVEQHHDDRGIALTAATAAFSAHIVVLGNGADLGEKASQTYQACSEVGVDVLWDDRGQQAGEQLADADLIGAAVRVTLGRVTRETGKAELRERRTGRTHVVALGDVAEALGLLTADLQRREAGEAISSLRVGP